MILSRLNVEEPLQTPTLLFHLIHSNHAVDVFVPTINIHQAGAYVYVPNKGVFSYDGVTTIFIADKETGLPSPLIVDGKTENQVTLTCAPFLPLSKNKPVDW